MKVNGTYVRRYAQEFCCLSPRRQSQDDGVTYTIHVTATSRKQAQRRINLCLYGNGCIAITPPTVVKVKK